MDARAEEFKTNLLKRDRSMNVSFKNKLIQSCVCVLIAILMMFASGLRFPYIDNATDNYFSESIIEAGAAYTSCRVLNASVSVVQESSLHLEPAGVGISLAIGQVLDPINDMTERLSDILVTAITSIGVQKIVYEIAVSVVFPLLAGLLMMLSILLWFDNPRITSLATTLIKVAVLLVIARTCLPVSAIANSYVNDNFFTEKVTAARAELSIGSAELEKLGNLSLPEIDGVLGTIENSTSLLKQKSEEFKAALINTAGNMATIIDALLKLAYLYIGMFLFQIIILPLLAFWLMAKATNSLFYTHITMIKHAESSKTE